MLNYDRHGERNWSVTTRSRSGRLRSRLTRRVVVRCPIRGSINLRRQPKAALVGRGIIRFNRERTVIV